MAWRLAKSLETLRQQLNEAYPDRRKSSDGTIGDEAHASRSSDHNPWVKDGRMGVVTAIDFTHDPERGVDSQRLADALIASQDQRIKYVISNRRIASGDAGPAPWTWRKYTGTNPHDKHMHLSVKSDKKSYDDADPWDLTFPEVASKVAATDTAVKVARTGGLGIATATAATQVISAVTGPVAEQAGQVKQVIDVGGQVVNVTTSAVKVVPVGFWSRALAFVQSPAFLATALFLIIGAWALTYYLRKRKEGT